MKVLGAQYGVDEGYQFLALDLGGEPVRVYVDQLKRWLVDAGYVFLGAKWEGKLDPIDLPAGAAGNDGDKTLRGFTSDPVIVKLTQEFMRHVMEDRTPYYGPVNVPQIEKEG